MNNTQKFAELDKLSQSLKGLGMLSDEEFKKTPQSKKWNRALNKLPEKEKQEYGEYYKRNHEKVKKKQRQNLEELLCKHKKLHPYGKEWLENKLKEHGWAKEHAPGISEFRDFYPEVATQSLSNKETVFFTFAEAAKKKELFIGFEVGHKQIEQDRENFANLLIPETITVDYSEYSNVPMFKNNIYAKPYKDGIMLVTNIDRANRHCIPLTVGQKEKSTQIDGKIVVGIFDSRFRNFGQIDWTNKNFDEQIVFYIVIPKITKNKAVRIVFKNNIHLNKVIKLFRSGSQGMLPPGEFKHFYDSTTAAYVVSTGLHICREQKDPTKAANLKKFYNYSNRELLNASYQSSLVESANNCVLGSGDNIKLIEKNFWARIKEYKNKSLEEIKQEYMKDIFPFEKDLELWFLQSIDHKDKRVTLFFRKNFLKMIILYYHTSKGTTLCDGTNINIDIKTKTDCILFWRKIDLFELLFNVLNDKNFPLCIRDSKVINDVDIFAPVLSPHMSLSPISELTGKNQVEETRQAYFGSKNSKNNVIGKKQFSFNKKHILKEAMESQTGFLMPYDGVFELREDLIFKFIKCREYDDFITMLVCDREERYLIEVFSKSEMDFKYMLWNQLKYSENYSEECIDQIYIKLASVIRDSKILIERDSTMGYRGRRKPYGSNTSSTYNVYFPRRSYRRTYSKEQTKREKDFFSESRKFSGSRRAHIRRLPEGSKPSKIQLILASKLNFQIPTGYTFVKESMWGDKTMPQREKRYRTRSLNGVFYYTNKEKSEAETIHGLSPAGFEEYCEKRTEKIGGAIYYRRNYEDRGDGGIDIRAVKEFPDGTIKNLLIQCKHPRISNKPISPGAIRDFKAACDEEKTEHEKVLMFITSSTYSPGAREYAEKFNIELIDGDDLIK